MAVDPRRFDQIEKVVRDLRRAHDDAIATIVARLGAHNHPVTASTIDHGTLTGLTDDDHPQYLQHAITDAKGDLVAATAANSMARVPVGVNNQVLMAASAAAAGVTWQTYVRAGSASVATEESTSSTTYADLATPGPAVTIEVGPSGIAIVSVTAGITYDFDQVEGFASVDVSGANTIAAIDNNAAQTNVEVPTASVFITARFSALSFFTGLTPGSTTFTVKYRRGAASVDSAEFYLRKLGVLTF